MHLSLSLSLSLSLIQFFFCFFDSRKIYLESNQKGKKKERAPKERLWKGFRRMGGRLWGVWHVHRKTFPSQAGPMHSDLMQKRIHTSTHRERGPDKQVHAHASLQSCVYKYINQSINDSFSSPKRGIWKIFFWKINISLHFLQLQSLVDGPSAT